MPFKRDPSPSDMIVSEKDAVHRAGPKPPAAEGKFEIIGELAGPTMPWKLRALDDNRIIAVSTGLRPRVIERQRDGTWTIDEL